MSQRHGFLRLVCAVLPLTSLWFGRIALTADADTATAQHKAAGILIDRKDDSILIQGDGDDKPVKYLVNVTDKKLTEALKAVFSVSRVHITYKANGDARQLTSIKRQVPKTSGTVTGLVVKNHEWWIEVKPKTGLSDGYACNFPFDQNKDMMEQLKGLQAGDSVTITFTTDFERHRIQTLQKNATPVGKEAPANGRGT